MNNTSHLDINKPVTVPTFRGRFFTGHYWALKKDWLAVMVAAMKQEGSVVRIPVLHRSIFLLSGPEFFHHVLVANHNNYLRGKGDSAKVIKTIVGEGVLTSDGSLWAESRKGVKESFKKSNLHMMPEVSVQFTEELIAHFRGLAQTGEAIELARYFMALTSQISFFVLFGVSLTLDEALSFVDSFLAVQDFLFHKMGNPFQRKTGKVANSIKAIHQLADRIAIEGNQKIPTDQILTFLASAPENPSNLLSWTVFLLANHPDTDETLRAALKQDERAYMDLVLRESLRLYPGAWGFDRVAQQADIVHGYHIPKGALVFLSPFIMHRNPACWEEPDKFSPERFLPEHADQFPSKAYLPFGLGPRKCIGEHFGMRMVEHIFPVLIKHLRFHLSEKERGETRPMFTLRPKSGILANLEFC